MPVINLTNLDAEPQAEAEPTKCELCNKPFQHYTKSKTIKGQEPLVEIEFISCHPECKKVHNKMQKLKNRIIKAKKTLHDLRTAQLNLEFEMFLAGQQSIDQDTDEIFVMLKEKNIF